jgi:pimeloyl-ACP methyl ester carboxylesterase
LYLGDYVRLLESSIEELNLINPVVIGHSFGGKVILKTLLNNPQAFNRIVLINSAGIKPNNTIKKALFRGISKTAGKVAELPLLNKFKDQLEYGYYRYVVRELDYYKSKPMRETFKNVIAEDLDKQLSAINIPSLIIWGKQDKITPLWMGQKMHALLKGSQLQVVEGYGHGLPLVNPQKVAELIYNYLHS